MEETPNVPPPSRSLLYAIGRLTAQVEGQTQEVSRLREAHEGLPQQLALMVAPLSSRLDGYDIRLGRLEKRQWLYIGGASVVIYAVTQALPLLHLTIKP